jgi:8-oxo-dGTP pyrophosphatase MutT (NUDIX family)
MRRVKHSVAVMIVRDGQVLSTKRPLTDDELPGVWGLPAGSIRGSETVTDVIARIGSEKLGVTLKPIKQLAFGVQDRPEYRLEMELWEATMSGAPNHPDWKWASLDLLKPGVLAGSLCCQLAIQTKSRVS